MVKETKIIQCNIRDIRERKQKEDKITELARIIDFTGDAVIGKDLSGIVTSWNNGAKQIYGYESDEIIGRSISIIVDPDSKDDIENILKRVEEGELLSHYDATRIRKDGERINVSLMISPVLDDQGQIIGSSTISSDVTERKRIEDALQLANKKLGLLSSITRHDINNEMTVLLGNIELLEGKNDDPWSKAHFHQVKEATEHISSIIKFSKMYSDIGVQAPRWNNVRNLVKNSAKEVRLRNVKVVNDIPEEIEVLADPLILNVFFNLMDNAVKHGKKVDNVRFYLEEHEGVSSIVCEDNGIGVPAEKKENIFMLASDKTHGVFLSREILSITGITIVEVGEPGHGAKFVMTVPPIGIRTVPLS